MGPALLGFSLALLAVAWAWLNFSWFVSAYNTDDWVFRIATMVQMAGVIVLIASAVCAWMGVNVVVCLVVLTLAPIVTIVGFETVGHRHLADAEARERSG